MRILVQSVIISSAIFGFVGMGPATAAMGDVNAHIKEINALCDQQRRGEIPPTPSMCLPELPPGPVDHDHPDRR